jgi:hypothetical protein
MPATYETIATTTLGSATGTVTFSSIPSTYTDLVIVISPTATNGNYDVGMRYNSDSGSNYSWTSISFNADNSGSAYSERATNATSITARTNIATVNPYPVIFEILNYSNTTTYKTSLSRIARETYAVARTVGLWRSTSAINEVSFVLVGGGSTTYKAGTVITLYGIKAA